MLSLCNEHVLRKAASSVSCENHLHGGMESGYVGGTGGEGLGVNGKYV